MLDLYTKRLAAEGVFDSELPPIVSSLIKAIPNDNIPDRMKVVIALSEISTFTSQFRRNMWHWDGFELPMNAVAMLIAGSGMGKDSAVKAVRRAFAPAYNIIDEKREQLAIKNAIKEAEEAGESDPSAEEVYKPFFIPPAPIYLAPTTPQGFIQHINDIADLPIGSGTTYSGEFGDELATNGYMQELIKTISETYDTGDKEMVYTKGVDFRSKEISAMPVSALLVSSPDYVIYDEAVKRKFLIAFGSKLARRCLFCYISKGLPTIDFTQFDDPIQAELDHSKKVTFEANKYKELIAEELVSITNYHLAKGNDALEISSEVYDLFNIYKSYNTAFSKTLNPKYPLSKLVREHLQWKALKLAGTFAILRKKDSVGKEDFIDAIRVIELLDSDMSSFEAELVKEPYEVFADFMRTNAVQGKSTMGLHDLRKRKFLPTAGDPARKMKELLHLVIAYDKSGTYEIIGTDIVYEAIIKTDILNVSFKPVDNTGIYRAISDELGYDTLRNEKSFVAATAQYGLDYGETSFADLANLLTEDMAYSPFFFEGGRRKKENIRGGAKWVVFDVDESDISAEEAHLILEDFNHHIALSSDPTNEFKFRVLLELDSIVEVDGLTWRNFYSALADDLGLTVDHVPQSQIFFSYSNGEREILSQLDAATIEAREYLIIAKEKTASSPDSKPLTTPQKKAKVNDERNTFARAFEAAQGKGSIKLLWAARHGYHDLGMSKEDIVSLIERINDYWTVPMPQDRLEMTVLAQIRRWS